MHPLRRAFSTLLLLAPLTTLISSAQAQTYNPKTILFDAPPSVDTAGALHIAAIPSGVPLTKQQIEVGLQRLADTGLFSAVSYTVNPTALTIKLTPSASSQILPVRFANFVWWQPAELETLLEARVPGYHGQLPVAGSLTDQVEATLVSLLHEKGIDATVTALAASNGPTAATSLTITSPSIVIDQVNLENALPALKRPLQHFADSLHTQDFDIDETTQTIHESVGDIYQNAGYLDVSTTAPTISAPRKDLLNYAVDLTSTIQPGDLYAIRAFTIPPILSIPSADLEKAANLHIGDPASASALRLANAELAKACSDQGYLEAKATVALSKDASAHTVAYAFTITPGELYHFASIDTSALPPAQQSAFAQRFHITAGAVAGGSLNSEVIRALNDMHALKTVKFGATLDRAHHTITIVLTPSATH